MSTAIDIFINVITSICHAYAWCKPKCPALNRMSKSTKYVILFAAWQVQIDISPRELSRSLSHSLSLIITTLEIWNPMMKEFLVTFLLWYVFVYLCNWCQEKKKEIWLSPMTKAPTLTEKSKKQLDSNITKRHQNFDYTTIVVRLRTVS